MNERIRGLIQAADRKCSETRGVYDEILAELIVRECLAICDEVQWQYGQYTFTATTVKNRVKEHFGIEE